MISGRRLKTGVGTLLAALSLSLLVAPPAAAAKIPVAGYPCTSKEAGKTIQTKAMKAKGLSLICIADDSEDAHEHKKQVKGKHSAAKMQYKWAWWTPPAASSLDVDFSDIRNRWEAAVGKDFDLIKAINAPYSRDEAAPCKINGLPIDSGSNVSYGSAGLYGRDASGYSPTFGTVTIGVVISVPTDYRILDTENAARNAATVTYSEEETVTYPAKRVNYNNIKTRVQNLESYLRDYFLEQSYGKLNVEFEYYPRLVRGNRSVEDMTRDNWQAVAVQAYNAANQVEDSFWESNFSNVTTVWSLIVDKPGAYAARAFREIEAGRNDIVPLQTPVGDFRTTLQTPIPKTGNRDKPLIAHEIYHSLRLPDSYQRGSNPVSTRIAGRIGRGASGYSTSGMLGWDRYVSRWLTDDNIVCTTPDSLKAAGPSGSTVTLRAIQEPVLVSDEKKLIVIPLGFDSAIVVESWRPVGSDRANALTGRRDTAQSGALVYVLNASSNNGLDVRYRDFDWPRVDSPVTLWRESLWTLRNVEFPSRLDGCEEGVPSEDEDASACNNAMESLIREEAFLRGDGIREMRLRLRGNAYRSLCPEPEEPNPFSPTYTQDQTYLWPWLSLQFVADGQDTNTVRAAVECTTSEG